MHLWLSGELRGGFFFWLHLKGCPGLLHRASRQTLKPEFAFWFVLPAFNKLLPVSVVRWHGQSCNSTDLVLVVILATAVPVRNVMIQFGGAKEVSRGGMLASVVSQLMGWR